MSNPYPVDGPYTLQGSSLTFFVTDAAVALRCWHARENNSELTVTLTEAEGTKDVTGTIQKIQLVTPGMQPSWQVVMHVPEHSG